jgi:ribose transport system substrate-binding protein
MSFKRKNLFALLLIALFVVGCGQEKAEQTSVEKRTYKLAIAVSSDDSNARSLFSGAEAEGIRLKDRNIEIKIVPVPNQDTPEKQAEAIRNLIEQDVQGLAVSCLPGDAVKQAIDECVDAGMKVVTFKHDSPDSKRSACFAVQPQFIGGVAVRLLEKEIGGPGAIAVLADSQSSIETAAMMKGIQRRTNGKDNLLQVLSTVYCDGDPKLAWQLIEETQKNEPDILGWIWLGAWPLYAEEPKFELLESVNVVSSGLSKETTPFLEQGKISALIGRDHEAWGGDLLRILIDLVDEEKTFREITWLRPSIVTHDMLNFPRFGGQ